MAAKPGKNEKTLTVPQLRYLAGMEREKMRELTRRHKMTARLLEENMAVQEAVKELKENGSKDTIIPLGAGIFVSGSIAPKSYKRTLPGNVVLPTTHAEIEKDLAERKKILEEDLNMLQKEIQATGTNLDSMNMLLDTVRQKIQANKKK